MRCAICGVDARENFEDECFELDYSLLSGDSFIYVESWDDYVCEDCYYEGIEEDI